MTMKRFGITIGSVLLVVLLLLTITMPAATQQKITIGVSIRSLSEERWARERDLMEEKAKELGVDIIFTRCQ